MEKVDNTCSQSFLNLMLKDKGELDSYDFAFQEELETGENSAQNNNKLDLLKAIVIKAFDNLHRSRPSCEYEINSLVNMVNKSQSFYAVNLACKRGLELAAMKN